MGEEPVDKDGRSAAQVLGDPAGVAQAARWRTGNATRRMTSMLCRMAQNLKGWVGGPTRSSSTEQQVPVPVRPRPLRGQLGAEVPPAGPQWRSWLPSRWKWWMIILVMVAVLFPRIVALVIALVIRLVTRAVLSLIVHVFKEVWTQAMMAAAEVEEGIAQWLYVQLDMIVPTEPLQPPLLTNGPAALPSTSAPNAGQPHPTRPVDVLLVLMLGLGLRRPPQIGGRWWRRQVISFVLLLLLPVQAKFANDAEASSML